MRASEDAILVEIYKRPIIESPDHFRPSKRVNLFIVQIIISPSPTRRSGARSRSRSQRNRAMEKAIERQRILLTHLLPSSSSSSSSSISPSDSSLLAVIDRFLLSFSLFLAWIRVWFLFDRSPRLCS